MAAPKATEARTLGRFIASLPGRGRLELDLDPDVRISTDPEGLSRALADGPGKFAWWATLEAEAKAVVEDLENQRDALYAELYAKHAGGDADGKRVPVEAVKTAVARDGRYKGLLQQLAGANLDAARLGVAKRAMEHRKEALLAIASNYRAELDTEQRQVIRQLRGVYRPGPGAPERRG